MTSPASIRDVIVRPIREEEWEAYREIRLRALMSDPLAFGSTYAREVALAPEKWRERIRPSTNPPKSATWVALERTEKFVGTIAVVDIEQALHVFAMWVEPRFRRKGVGGTLLDAALAWVDDVLQGRPVTLEVNPRQVDAVRLYESRGFRGTGKTSPLGHTPGERVVEMVRAAVGKSASCRQASGRRSDPW